MTWIFNLIRWNDICYQVYGLASVELETIMISLPDFQWLGPHFPSLFQTVNKDADLGILMTNSLMWIHVLTGLFRKMPSNVRIILRSSRNN